jgi:hypothetical protein
MSVEELISRFASVITDSTVQLGAPLEAILQDIRDFAVLGSAEQEALGNTGIVPHLTTILNYLIDSDLEIIDNIACIDLFLQVLVKFCRREMPKSTCNRDNINQIMFINEKLIQFGKKYASNSTVALQICWLIMILASDDEENQLLLASNDATGLVIQIIDVHCSAIGSDESEFLLAEMVCRATRNLANNDEVAAKLVDEGVCDALVNLLKNYSKEFKNVYVIEAVMWVVVNLACDSNIATLFGAAGGCDAVIACIDDPIILCNESCLLAICRAVRNLACESAFNFSLLAATPVCERLMDILNTCSTNNNMDIVEQALWTISNLGCDQELCIRMCSLGAAELMINICNHFRSNTTVSMLDECLMWAIRNLASGSASNQVALVSANALAAIQSVLIHSIDDENLIEAAIGALVNIIYKNESHKTMCNSASGASPMDLIGYFCDIVYPKYSQSLIVTGIFVKYLAVSISNVDESKEYREIILQHGGQRHVADAIKVHNNEEVTRLGCEVMLHLYYLEESESNRLKIEELKENKQVEYINDNQEELAATIADNITKNEVTCHTQAEDSGEHLPPPPPPTTSTCDEQLDYKLFLRATPHGTLEHVFSVWGIDSIVNK